MTHTPNPIQPHRASRLRWAMIDNYDSFTYNIVQRFGEFGVVPIRVWRNDEISLDELIAYDPHVLVISPGPCSPNEAGISVAALRHFMGRIPVLGVCLGHQSIVQALGGDIVRAPRLMHGKTSPVFHEESGLYQGVANPFDATRYHSLIAKPTTLPTSLRVTAKTWEDEIMGIEHTEWPVFGVQYHPESILTVEGSKVLENFARVCASFWGRVLEPDGAQSAA